MRLSDVRSGAAIVKLTELEPRWWAEPGRHGMGVNFLCPCCKREMLSVAFDCPLDGGPPYEVPESKLWKRSGDTFETLTLSPSIDASHFGHWHGFITAGIVT